MEQQYSSVGIIGTGRVARALERALTSRGLTVTLMPARQFHPSVMTNDLVVLAISDDALATYAAAMPGHVRNVQGWRAPAVVHCSGALPTSVLEPLTTVGCKIGSWHPLQAIPALDTDIAEGITWAITADEPLAGLLSRLTAVLHGRPLLISDDDKPTYHAAACLAANYLITLTDHATKLLATCGITRESALLSVLPLLESTLDALDNDGLPDALTGPLARGDVGTVRRHLDALAAHPETRELYRVAGLATLPMLEERGLTSGPRTRLRQLLETGKDSATAADVAARTSRGRAVAASDDAAPTARKRTPRKAAAKTTSATRDAGARPSRSSSDKASGPAQSADPTLAPAPPTPLTKSTTTTPPGRRATPENPAPLAGQAKTASTTQAANPPKPAPTPSPASPQFSSTPQPAPTSTPVASAAADSSADQPKPTPSPSARPQPRPTPNSAPAQASSPSEETAKAAPQDPGPEDADAQVATQNDDTHRRRRGGWFRRHPEQD